MAFNPPAPPQRLLKDLHVAYVQSLDAVRASSFPIEISNKSLNSLLPSLSPAY